MSSSVDSVLKSKLVSFCRSYLHEPWASANDDDVDIVTLTGGVSNYVYVCSTASVSVLVRIFGNTSYDHSTEHVLFALLAEKHLGPNMLGCFEEGRIEEYVENSKAVHVCQVRKFQPQIAACLSSIHRLESMPIRKGHGWFEGHCQRFIRIVDKIDINEHEENQEEKAKLVNFDFRSELLWLLDHMRRVRSPIVFCHNDLQMNNILLVPKMWFDRKPDQSSKSGDDDVDRRVLLIDYEYAGFNYRAYDIANHFSECRYDYSEDADKYPFYIRDEGNFPDRQQQRVFVEAYLSSQKTSTNDDIDNQLNDEEVDKLMEEVSNFLLAPSFFWLLWTLSQSVLRPDIKFGYWEHASDRMLDYMTQKRILLKRKLIDEGEEKESGSKRVN